jgi:hypothetical protein
MKKTTPEQKSLEEILAASLGLSTPKVIKTVPLKKHFVKQIKEYDKSINVLKKKHENIVKEFDRLVKIRSKIWDKITKDVKAKPEQELMVNKEINAVQFLES